MICLKCDKNLLACECPGSPERIRYLLESPYLYFPPEHRQKLLEHAKKVETQKALTE